MENNYGPDPALLLAGAPARFCIIPTPRLPNVPLHGPFANSYMVLLPEPSTAHQNAYIFKLNMQLRVLTKRTNFKRDKYLRWLAQLNTLHSLLHYSALANCRALSTLSISFVDLYTVIMADQALRMPSHPYYPLDLELPGYTDNTLGLTTLLSGFSAGIALILGAARVLSRMYRPSISSADQFLVLWFVLCKYTERTYAQRSCRHPRYPVDARDYDSTNSRRWVTSLFL